MRLLIVVATHNRPVITELALSNLNKIKGSEDWLVIYDDASSAYDTGFLGQYADEVLQRSPESPGACSPKVGHLLLVSPVSAN